MTSARGMGAHQSSVNQTDMWLTPRHIMDALGDFDCDPCGAPDPVAWPTAMLHFMRRDDGLSLPWFGRVWLNPPYGAPSIIGPWLRKMVQHGRGTALIFARTETELFFECVWRSAAAVLFLEGRLFFVRPDDLTPAPHNAGAPSCLVAYGTDDATTLSICGLRGQYVEIPK